MRRIIEADERVGREGFGVGLIAEEEIPPDEWRFVMETRNRMLRRLDEQSERLQQEARSLLVSWEAMREILGSLATFTGETQILQCGLEALARTVGARYGALHVLDEHGQTVDFLHTGLDEEWERRLGGVELPRVLGAPGALHEGQVFRLYDVTRDPRPRGFGPEGHPPMRSFLGVPIAAKGRVFGRVYLAEKAGGPFTKDDEQLALTVAQSVALAVESMRLARRVRAAERLSRRTLASLFDAVVVLDRQCRVRYANRVVYDWFGLEPAAVVGRPLSEVLPLGDAAGRIEELVRDRVFAEPFEVTYRSEGGEERTFRATVSGLRVAEEEEEEEELLILEEITAYRRMAREQQALQVQLLQAEKLSALGGLVSGVAHELNNPLTVIMGRAQLLLRGELDERMRQALEAVGTQADRMRRIIQQLLTLGRKHLPERSWVDLNTLLRATVELRAYQMRVNNIAVRWDLDEALPRIFADPHQLGQVFV
ncbi:MAG: GAF domain-containing protein, partial [Candidatus Rokubacteria bacterium]|nr:GAF domain-containing protein [Candidatus Rokubacteria bacterium]